MENIVELNKALKNNNQAIIKTYSDNADELVSILKEGDIFCYGDKHYSFVSLNSAGLISANVVEFDYESMKFNVIEDIAVKLLDVKKCCLMDDDVTQLAFIDDMCVYVQDGIKTGTVDGRWEHNKLSLMFRGNNPSLEVVELSNILTTDRILRAQADIVLTNYKHFYTKKDYVHVDNDQPFLHAIFCGNNKKFITLSAVLDKTDELVVNLFYGNVAKATITYKVKKDTSNKFYDKITIEKTNLVTLQLNNND